MPINFNLSEVEIGELERSDPYLYILMRNDLDSLNPGKAIAQGVHAGNQFTHKFDQLIQRASERDFVIEESNLSDNFIEHLTDRERFNLRLFDKWKESTGNGFGVTITLGMDINMLYRVVEAARTMQFACGVTHDPSYPIQDGKHTHLIPLDTCGFVFGNKDNLVILLSQFNLLP